MRSLLRVGIRPLKNSRISFSVQLALVFFWLLYGGFMLYSNTGTNDQNFFTFVFIGLALLYLIYILAQNTSIFGTQSYLEITPAYIVQKKGHFRPKTVIAFEDVQGLTILPYSLRFVLKSDETETIDIKLVRKKKNLAKVKEKLYQMADRHRFAITENGLTK
jgi:hypothetical protein